jgi:hypothetical protein
MWHRRQHVFNVFHGVTCCRFSRPGTAVLEIGYRRVEHHCVMLQLSCIVTRQPHAPDSRSSCSAASESSDQHAVRSTELAALLHQQCWFETSYHPLATALGHRSVFLCDDACAHLANLCLHA